MIERFSRIGIIGRMEFRMRMRKNTAVASLLIIAAIVYLVIPDLSTGRSLLRVGPGRALYNSAAVALGAAVFCSALMSLLGFYICSNSVRRDILNRTGYIIAASPVGNGEYILGKFFGNLLYLILLVVTSLVSAMVMFLIRGETPLQPGVFLMTYAWLVLPSAFFCAAAAICFEAFPFLSGRAGDILFFLGWGVIISIPAMALPSRTGLQWTDVVDILGLGPLISQLQQQFKTTSISIGATDFDPRIAPVVFNGIQWSFTTVVARLITLVFPSLLLVAASLGFHRFNPTRSASLLRSSKTGMWRKFNNLLRPVSKFAATLIGKGSSIPSAVLADAALTIVLSPFFGVSAFIVLILSLTLQTADVRATVLPIIVVVLVMLLSDISVRDHASGMQELIFSLPRRKRHYIFWKFCSALLLTLCLTGAPLLRFIHEPKIMISIVSGSILLSAGAVSFGILTRSGKLFVAVFLLLLYIGLNAREVALFDFIGISGAAGPVVQGGVVLLSALLILAATLRHRTAVGP